MIQEDEAAAKKEAERQRPGLIMFTDGPRLDTGASGYAVTWQSGQLLGGRQSSHGYDQKAYDAECAALARALEIATRRQAAPERVTMFNDTQAAIRRIPLDEPGPGQKYTIQTRRHIAALRKVRPSITIEIRWCPVHKGVPWNEMADEWAKLAAEEQDAHGVEWLEGGARPMPLPRSLVHFQREISEKKWIEARQWAGGRTFKKKYKMPAKQKPDGTVAGSSKRHASRFY
jgi:ribonuclease HI